MAWLLQQDEELQEVLSDALMRSEQHRENYLRSKNKWKSTAVRMRGRMIQPHFCRLNAFITQPENSVGCCSASANFNLSYLLDLINSNFLIVTLIRLKSELEVALHEHKALEGELERSRAEAEDQVENYFEDDDHDHDDN